MRKIVSLCSLIVALAPFNSCYDHSKNNINSKLDSGYVPNETTAIKIAEVVWLNIYGSEIEDEKPFKARLKDKDVWIIEGTFNNNGEGGVAYMEIQKSDGKILKVIHGK